MQKLITLSFCIGSIIKQEYIDSINKEADEFPVGSTYWKAFKRYAKSLEKRLEEQDRLK